MRSRPFGRLGWPVSEIGYGLWGMGGWSGSDDAESIAALERSVDLGCTFFDTALAYGNGKSEQLLAQVLARHRGRPLRIATKVPPKNLRWPALAAYELDEVFPADHIRASTETSLRNLGLSSVDLQQLHVWTDAWADDDRWKRAVDDLKSEGLIRGFGISINRWEPASVLKAIDTGVVDSVQVVYNVFDQNPEDELFPKCRERGVAVIARVPFDEGSLTGTMHTGMTWPEGDWRNWYFTRDKLAETLDRVTAVRADLPPALTLPEAALRFILACPDVSTVIPGMRRPRHVEQNLAVSEAGPLAADLVARLRRHRWTRTYVVP
ncbi:MAG TPA: aldo/keto reductase [Vicinamibacterales bacterium]|nr:aldo/keto reductase [Vicinamibacterales bacterium]